MVDRGLALLLVLLSVLGGCVRAQAFNVRVESLPPQRGHFSLFVYDSPDAPRRVKASAKDGALLFHGSVSSIAYAELRHSAIAKPLPFFLENSDISIRYNTDDPERSPIVGSRANSEYRYALEACGGDPVCLIEQAHRLGETPVAPYLVYRYLSDNMDVEALRQMLGLFSGDAVGTYHYSRLQRRLERAEELAVGNLLPDFVFTDAQGQPQHSDSVLTDSVLHVLAFGATWCGQCHEAERQLEQHFPQVQTLAVYLDHDPQGWDAPWMEMLDIDHVPYLIVLNADRTVRARDVSVWELKRVIKEYYQ